MKQRLFVLAVVVTLSCVNQAFASWDATGTISFLETSAEVRVKVGSMSIDHGPCGNPHEYALERNNVNYEAIYSLLLAAYMANKQVSIDLNDCSASGLNRIVGARFAQ